MEGKEDQQPPKEPSFNQRKRVALSELKEIRNSAREYVHGIEIIKRFQRGIEERSNLRDFFVKYNIGVEIGGIHMGVKHDRDSGFGQNDPFGRYRAGGGDSIEDQWQKKVLINKTRSMS